MQIYRSNFLWQKHNEIRGMFVSLRVMDRDLAMSSVHVSHRPTFSEWYIHKVQMAGSKCFIFERICFVQLYEKKVAVLMCGEKCAVEVYERQANFSEWRKINL